MYIMYFEILKAKTLYKYERIKIMKPLLLSIGRPHCSPTPQRGSSWQVLEHGGAVTC